MLGNKVDNKSLRYYIEGRLKRLGLRVLNADRGVCELKVREVNAVAEIFGEEDK